MSTELKNVVIIGLGPGGGTTARALETILPATHRIVAVTSDEFAYWPIGALRAAVVEGFEQKVVAPLSTFFAKGSRHVVLTGVTVTELKDNSLKLSRSVPGFGEEIAFDYAVIATGSAYAFPARPPAGVTTLEGISSSFKQAQADIAKASSLLIVGTGPVGIEFAGEVAGKYGKAKKVTLVGRASSLPGPGWKQSFSDKLVAQLKELGVELHLSSGVDLTGIEPGLLPAAKEFTLTDGKTVSADYVLLAAGNKANSGFVSALDPSAVNSAGLVATEPTLQVKGHPTLFAVGDITDIPETKMVAFIGKHGPVAAGNIVSLIKGQPAKKTYAASGPMMLVTLGENGGAASMPMGIVLGAWAARMIKSKTLFISNFTGIFAPSAPAPSSDKSKGSSTVFTQVLIASSVAVGALAWIYRAKLQLLLERGTA